MVMLIVGLLLFLGIHSVRMVAPAWREQFMKNRGENAWKGLYSVVSLIGLVLMVVGFGQARLTPVVLWVPPVALRHLALLLMALSWVLLVSAYVPKNHFKAWVGHPMVAGVKTWALAHLLANGNLHSMLLFASFLVWSIFIFVALRRRDRAAGTVPVTAAWGSTVLALTIGLLVYGLFVSVLHQWIIGRPVLGG
jgi:uncharacterized membrane protein